MSNGKKLVVWVAYTCVALGVIVGWSVLTLPAGPATAPLEFPQSFLINDAAAEDSCNWNTESNGCQFGVCVDDSGRMYCQRCCNGACSRVSCN